MSIMSALILYIVIWTVVLFVILPFGVNVPEVVEEGHATSAPQNPQILKKMIITSAISLALWGLAYAFLTSDLAHL